jgi:hypothetical protein
MTLHDAILIVLKDKGFPMTTREIAKEINEKRLYNKKDKSPITDFQVHGRTKNYPSVFMRKGTQVSLVGSGIYDLYNKVRQVIDIAWESYKNKVASRLLEPENEKMMQLQFALILQTLIPLFEFRQGEILSVLLEVPVTINRSPNRRIIDIVVMHFENDTKTYFPIELKCFRKLSRGKTTKRGAGNLGMYDYWADIENIEQYTILENYGFGTHLMISDDAYYYNTKHTGNQVSVYSTNLYRDNVTGLLNAPIANRQGNIDLKGSYSMTMWEQKNQFYFIRQEARKHT